MNKDKYGAGYSDKELQEHYVALFGVDRRSLTREELINTLRGSEFDEHAYLRQEK